MNGEEIIRTARGAGLLITTAYGDKPELARFFQAAYAAGAAAERNKLAAWMMRQGYATGHGDSIEKLLEELEWQIEERIRNEREACAELVWPTQQVKVWSDKELTDMTVAFNRTQEKHGYGWYETIMAVGATALKDRAAAIRARSKS